MTTNQTTHSIARSADGTSIAYETYGAGPVVVVVGGAFNDRNAGRELAQAVATEGLTGVAYDRRGRGDSGDTKPYAVQREIEDLTAVISAAGGGTAARPAHAHGVSSGGALVLQALAAGAPVATASVLEPPYRVEGAPPWPERYIETLEELEANGDRDGILRYFHTRAVGLPEEMLDGMRGTPMWEALLATIGAPVLAVSSTGTAMPFLPTAARAVAEALPRGEYQQLEGGFHEVPAPTLAPVIADFVRRASS